MKRLYISGKVHCNVDGIPFEVERIVKTDTDIIGYNGEQEVFAFRGIKDFSLFTLEEGQEFDLSEQLKQDLVIAEAYEGLYSELLSNSLAIAEVYEMVTGGGQ